jgi:hypothetical protein
MGLPSRLEYLLTVNSCQGYFSLCRQRFRELGPYKPRERGPPRTLTSGRLIHVLPNPRFEPTPQSTLPLQYYYFHPCPLPPTPVSFTPGNFCYYSTTCPLPAARGVLLRLPRCCCCCGEASKAGRTRAPPLSLQHQKMLLHSPAAGALNRAHFDTRDGSVHSARDPVRGERRLARFGAV